MVNAVPGPSVFTVGHGTLPQAAFVDLVRGADLAQVVDVRSYPGSRRNPQYGRAQLQTWLPEAGVDYSWEPRLGGRRRPDPGSPHTALRHPAFQAYADHMRSADFRSALDQLVELAGSRKVAIMCSEGVWWRCHRRLIADALVLLCDAHVTHLFHDGRVAAHQPTPEARAVGSDLVYDLGSATPLL
jgi:uncharacterized protein (DUF488 family)